MLLILVIGVLLLSKGDAGCSESACKILSDEWLDHNLFSCEIFEVCHCHNQNIGCGNTTELTGCLYLHACCTTGLFPCCIGYDLKCLKHVIEPGKGSQVH